MERANASGWPRPSSVGAGGVRGVAAAREKRSYGLRADPGLVAQHQHEHVGVRVDGAERGGDGGRAPLAEVPVLDDLDAFEVNACAHVVGGATDHADQLVERAGARVVEHVVEQRTAVVRKQLLGGAEALRPAGGEDQAGDEGLAIHAPDYRLG